MPELNKFQAEINYNTFNESDVNFQVIDYSHHRYSGPYKIGLCQLKYDCRELLKSHKEYDEKHIEKLIRFLDYAKLHGIDIVFFPELCFPPVESDQYRQLREKIKYYGFVVVAGSKVKADKALNQQIWIDRSRIIARRQSYIFYLEDKNDPRTNQEIDIDSVREALHRINEQDSEFFAFQRYGEEKQGKQYYYNIQICINGNNEKRVAKNVLTLPEVLADIAPGSNYGILKTDCSNFFLATCSEFLGNVARGYQGEAVLIQKIFSFNENKKTKFYRLNMRGFYDFRQEGEQLHMMAVLSYERNFPLSHWIGAMDLMKQNHHPSVVLYINEATRGLSSILLKSECRRMNPEEVAARSPHLEYILKDRVDIIHIKEGIEGLMVVDLIRDSNKIKIHDINFTELSQLNV